MSLSETFQCDYGHAVRADRKEEETNRRVRSIRETACRFLHLLEATDQQLFSECMRHSSLGVHFLQNITDVTHTASNECVMFHTVQSEKEVFPSEPHDNEGVPNNEGSILTKNASASGVWCQGQHSLFTAQSDLLCAILRSESVVEQQMRGNATTAVNQLTLLSPFPSSSSSTSSSSFTDSILALDPLAPLHILSAVAASLHSLTLLFNPSGRSNSVTVRQHIDRT